ncbi:hypothetical protein RFI_13496 [Reticulomyxa filosa]|uniref:Uncharacterized protein n=1 Tax=Reticulomyxa filosa TaxID=46433 RepID=X6NCE5_RETFI|nr:hypothetical protein RFI_13496 [Reticulomyxa filosa]|eukprot:ETO23681.1 hypothetical protein RFI_13496 [Reticulomyxa filosa]
MRSDKAFELNAFVPRMRVYMNKKNPNVRELLIQWVALLSKTPGVEMLKSLPHVLDGLFEMVEDEKDNITRQTELLLHEFLRDIGESMQMQMQVDLNPMIAILGKQLKPEEEDEEEDDVDDDNDRDDHDPGHDPDHSHDRDRDRDHDNDQKEPNQLKQTKPLLNNKRRRAIALSWLHEFLKLGKFQLREQFPSILVVLLKCIQDADTAIATQGYHVNQELFQLVKTSSATQQPLSDHTV